MAKYTRIQPDETVDAIQIQSFKQMENYYSTPVPKEYEGQPSIGKNLPIVYPGDWVINDGVAQIIMPDIEFQQRFRRVEEPRPALMEKGGGVSWEYSGKDEGYYVKLNDEKLHFTKSAALRDLFIARLKTGWHFCRKCGQYVTK